MGSLIAALASYLDARANNGQWLLRMEDLDPPREEPGAARRILSSLVDHGLHWDGDVLWQSHRSQAYQQALEKLAAQDRLFRCDCTRAMLGPGGACAGRCLPRQADITEPCALRVRVPVDCHITFNDGIQGRQSEALGQHFPDFILRRKDGLYAYQLAVVVDDAFQEIDHVLRGSDLLDSTGRQIYLQQLLEFDQPSYSHFPVITNTQGQKYSKQNHAPALLAADASENLREALAFLQQPQVPKSLRGCPQILARAVENWSKDTIPGQMAIVAADP
jgi:glutamyl-Q tRNA(Asp) synthetase